jgi:hypothetical protein
MNTDKQRQATYRAKLKEDGFVYLHVPMSPATQHQLLTIAERLKMTHRQVVEFLLNKEASHV